MDKLERIVSVPACYIGRQTADQIATQIKTVAEEHAAQDYQLALQQFSAQLRIGVQDLLVRVPDEVLPIKLYHFEPWIRQGPKPHA